MLVSALKTRHGSVWFNFLQIFHIVCLNFMILFCNFAISKSNKLLINIIDG